ncbi:MAG: hypothetical protein STSR0008_25560 [Ignavibacterium sp.]
MTKGIDYVEEEIKLYEAAYGNPSLCDRTAGKKSGNPSLCEKNDPPMVENIYRNKPNALDLI